MDRGKVKQAIPLIDRLRTHDYAVRKYRARGDAWYEMGNQRASMEYHGLAAAEERKLAEIENLLEDLLGPRGALPDWLAGDSAAAREAAAALPDPWRDRRGNFDEACFFARYPRWAGVAPEPAEAFAAWRDDPRFLREAPRFRPVNPDWLP